MSKEKFTLSFYDTHSMDESKRLIADFQMKRLADDVYNEVVVRIADEIKNDVIEKVKKGMMKNKRLTTDLQEEIKKKLIEKMLPNEVEK